MILTIEADFKVTSSFLRHLRKYFKSYFYLVVDPKQLKKNELKINSLNIFDKNISLLDIFLLAFESLKFKMIGGKNLIFIDENILYKDMEINLSSLCNFITFGNMEFEGYPILKDIFIHFQNNIKKYRDKFIWGVL